MLCVKLTFCNLGALRSTTFFYGMIVFFINVFFFLNVSLINSINHACLFCNCLSPCLLRQPLKMVLSSSISKRFISLRTKNNRKYVKKMLKWVYKCCIYGNSQDPRARSFAELPKSVVELSNLGGVFQKHSTTLILKGFWKCSYISEI